MYGVICSIVDLEGVKAMVIDSIGINEIPALVEV